MAEDIEKGIYNKTIEIAEKKNINKKWWTDSIFVDIYKNNCIEVCSNLDGESYIKNDRLFQDWQKKNLAAMN